VAVDTEHRTLPTDQSALDLLAAVEKDFRRQGLPSLAPTRPLPDGLQTACLVVALASTVAVVVSLVTDASMVFYIAAPLWGIAAVLLLFDDHARGEYSAWEVAKAGFVTAPIWFVLFLVALDSWQEALAAIAVGLGFMVVFVLTMSLVLRVGFFTLAMSIFRSLAGARRATMSVAGRAAPITLAVLFVAFLSDEAWKVMDAMSLTRYLGLVGTVLAIAVLAAGGAAWSERALLQMAEGGPASNGSGHRTEEPEPDYKDRLERTFTDYDVPQAGLEELSRLQKINVAFAFASTILARVLIVWLLVGATFLLIGVIAVDDAVAGALLGKDSADGGLTWTLVGLAFLLGAVASLTFAAGALAVQDQRRELVEDQAARLRGRLIAWQQYAALRPVVGDEPVGGRFWHLH
jgi:hypothetical protein